jgi:hypothetical protein
MLGIDEVIVRLWTNVEGPIYLLLAVVCFIGGSYMVGNAFVKLRQIGRGDRQIQMGGVLIQMAMGVAVLSLTQTMAIGGATTFGASTPVQFSGLTYTGTNPDLKKRAEAIIGVLLRIVMFTGWWAVASGLRLFARRANGDQAIPGWAPWVHLVGGAFAANIVSLIQSLQATVNFFIIK